MRTGVTFTIFALVLVAFFRFSQAEDELQPGTKYELIQPVYIMGTYNSLNNRILSSDTASAYLHSKRYYDKSHVAFQYEVPVGTIITILRKLSNPWHLPFLANRFLVKLIPDLSNGLNVELVLNRGMEGNLDGLNSELFIRKK